MVGLALLGSLVYAFWPLRRAGFINLDDEFYVTANSHVTAGLTWSGVKWALTDTHLGTWHPLTWISHMLDGQVFGVAAGGPHLTNWLFHAANTLLLFLLLGNITGACWRSAWVAACFGLHPLHVESVAWISERKDVLSMFFCLLTIWAYGRYARAIASSKGWYGLSLGFFAMGLLCKPMLVTVPLLLLLLDWWPFGRFPGRTGTMVGHTLAHLVREKIPFLVLAVADGLVTIWAQSHAGAVKGLAELPVAERAANAFVAYLGYIGKMFWPTDLSIFYPFPAAQGLWQPSLAILCLAGVSTAVFVGRARRPYLVVGWFWYLAAVTPVIGFLQTGMQSMADRYTYLPITGLFLAIGWLAGEIGAVEPRRRLVSAVGVLAVVASTVATRRQAGYWISSEMLFGHSLTVTRENALAHHCLGSALFERGELGQAGAHFREALKIRPDYQAAEVGLAMVLAAQGEAAEARSHFEAALKRNPLDAEARLQFAAELAREGQVEEAIEQYREVVRSKPDSVEALNDLGNTLQRLGRVEEAVVCYQQALRAAPDSAPAHNNLGIALFAKGQTAEAISHYEAALRSRPGYAEAHNNLGNALAADGKIDLAVTNFLRAIACRPQYPKAENSLGCALAMEGRTREAIAHFNQALRWSPSYAEAHFNLANALMREGRESEAADHLSATLSLQPASPKALIGLASLYARGKEGSLHRPAEAVRLAELADELTGRNDADVLATLAEAYAAAGRLTNAVASAQRALGAAMSSGRTNLAEALSNRLREFQR